MRKDCYVLLMSVNERFHCMFVYIYIYIFFLQLCFFECTVILMIYDIKFNFWEGMKTIVICVLFSAATNCI